MHLHAQQDQLGVGALWALAVCIRAVECVQQDLVSIGLGLQGECEVQRNVC